MVNLEVFYGNKLVFVFAAKFITVSMKESKYFTYFSIHSKLSSSAILKDVITVIFYLKTFLSNTRRNTIGLYVN